MPAEHPKAWYAKGLRFKCSGCGACCTTHGEAAYVYLTEPDLRAIAHFLDLERGVFLERYCTRDEGRVVLRMDAPACPFLDEAQRCRIYPVRPKQCATWPFWEENLERAQWEGEVSALCPGIGQGELFPAAEIERLARETEDWYEGSDGVPE